MSLEPSKPRRTLLGVVRSEARRLNRRTFTGIGAALIALFAFVGTAVVFMAGEGLMEAQMPPGMGIPIDVESARGIVAGLPMATDLIGIVALSLWAAAAASDYTSGWIRLMVQAEPRRWRLLAGKLFALTGFTLVGTTIATGVVVALAHPMADAAGASTALWSNGTVRTILGGWVNLTTAVLVWGTIGFAIAIVARSAVISIAGGIGYLMVFEGVLRFTAEDAVTYLPGSILTAVGAGGTPDLDHSTALLLAAVLAIGVLGLTVYVFHRRDITS